MENMKMSLNQEYIEKLDAIINFFKSEKEDDLSFLLMGKEDSKYYYSIFISMVALFIAIISNLLNIEKISEYGIIIIISAMVILIAVILYDSLHHRTTEKIIDRSVKYNVIINFLQSLKILPYQVDLLPLINVIMRKYHVDTWVKLLDKRKYISNVWYDEIVVCLDNINNEITEKHKSK